VPQYDCLPVPLPVRRIEHLPLAMDDGVVLSAAVLMPDAPGPFSAIVDAVPYRKDDDFLWSDWDTYGYLAARGFACVRIDLRGSGSSTGILDNEYRPREQDDLVEAIAQIAAADWCSGAVGMTGVSWGGFNAVQVAMRRPPALRAIVPIHFSADRYHSDVHYNGGTLLLGDAGAWPGEMVAEMGLPPRPDIIGDDWVEVWRDRLERTPQWTFEWLRHQRRDDYWRHGSWCEHWEAVACPVLAIGGWIDSYQDACLAMLAATPAPNRAVIGPWGHTRPHRGWPRPALEHRELMCRWFDRFLNGVENGVDTEPRLVAYLRDGVAPEPYPDVAPGRWRAWRTWPPATPPAELHLTAEGLRPIAPTSPCTWTIPPGPQWLGSAAPWWGAGSPPVGQSDDLRAHDALGLTFDTPPLAAPLEILGFPRLEVAVSADRPVALLAVRLEHIHPDGFSALVCRGALNLTRRESHAEPAPLEAGRVYHVSVPLVSTGTAIPAGHVLRLALAGTHWPVLLPPPEPVTLTIHGGRFVLPAPGAADEVAPPPMPEPVAADSVPNPVRPLDGPLSAWTTTRDSSGTTAMRVTGGWESVWDEGRTFGSSDLRVTVTDDDPTSCRVVSDNIAECVGRLELTCDHASLHVAIDVTVERDGEPFFARGWRESFVRDLL
jgi:uncharacterized protein